MAKLKIASISSEVHPFSITGGLANVARSLPKALKRLGHDVIAITPLYAQVIDKKQNDLKLLYKDVKIKVGKDKYIKVNYWRGYLMKDLPVYFIENEKYFSRRKTLYGSSHENARFYLFDVAALKLLIKLKFNANIIHCHDWHTGLIPYLLKRDFKHSSTLKNAATVFTIHNLAFQLGHNWWEIPSKNKDYGRKELPEIDDSYIENINFAKRAILHADAINAVSETYAQEIMKKEFGQDLHLILNNRQERVFGIVNGIDYSEYNPATDPGLFKNYSFKSPHLKNKNKLFLQNLFNLPEDEKIPVIGMVTRIAEQKGFDLLFDTLDAIMKLNVQLVIMGGGDKNYIRKIETYIKNYPKKIAAYLKFTTKHATKVYAGSDMFLMPSRFEPCGITQLEAMRYGSIPIVRHIGGLIDTVRDYDPETKKGSGFVFQKYDSKELLIAVTQAVENYKYKDDWKILVTKVMESSYSWELPAEKYVELFKMAIKFKKNGKIKNKKK